MRRFLANLISVIYSFIRFSIIRIFRGSSFRFFWIERFSPNVIVRIPRKSSVEFGRKISIHSGSKVLCSPGGSLRIGDGCRFNYNCMIVCRHNIQIAPGVEFGPNVFVYDHDHDFRAEGGLKAGKFKLGSVTIGKNCWIGANTVILRDTVIGDNCVIGAGSVVKGVIPDNTVLVQKRVNEMKTL